MYDGTGGLPRNAFIYTGGVMYDLVSLLLPGSGITVLHVGETNAINDLGQIAAWTNGGGAVLLTPTPEPSSLALLGVAAVVLASRRNRHARAHPKSNL